MNSTTLHIKNMVCMRCVKVVRDEFDKLNLEIEEIEMGKVTISTPVDKILLSNIKEVLDANGFELIDDKRSQLIDSIKTLIIAQIHHSETPFNAVNSSDYISTEIGNDYSYLSHLFSSVEGITIEKYIIHQKIEKVKELLVYDELTLNQISYQLGYSSVQHLSNQFKKTTGFAPSHFKKLKDNKRQGLDQV